MAALLVGLSVMAVLMSMALPVWSHFAKREKEEELIWRGQQYARAIGLFQRKYANTFPPNVDILVEQKFLRKKYKDPITKDDFQLIPAGGGTPGQPGSAGGGQTGPRGPGGQAGQIGQAGQPQFQAPQGPGGLAGSRPGAGGQRGPAPSIGIQGVVSKSGESSIKMYNGRTKYNEWAFVYMATSQRLGPGGPPQPGAPGQQRPGQPVFGPGIPGGVPQRPPVPDSPFGQPPQRPPRP
jgi:type II secretory pathway pseudopilin PulG